MATVGVEKLARALNLEKRRVQQLVKEGMPREARGMYEPVKCLYWYVRYLQKAIEKKSLPTLEGGFTGEREERVRLLRSQADLAEIELSEQRSQLVAIQDVNEAWNDLAVTTRGHVMAVVPRLASQLLGQTSRIMVQAIIEIALREALLNISKSEPRRHEPR